MTFKPGTSGNPGGRPKRGNPAQKEAMKHAERAVKYQVSVMDDLDEKTDTRLKAAEYIITRAYGKPVESIELTGEDGDTIRQSLTVTFVRPNAST